jgi:hypothetical protein
VCRLDHASIRPPDLLDSEPQLRVYHIYPLGKVCVLLACPFVLTCSSICLQVQGCSWHSKNNTNWRRCNVAKAQRSPCGVVVGQHNVDPPQIELSPTLIERSGANPSGFHHSALLLSPFQIGGRFGKATYIDFAVHLDIYYIFIHSIIYVF